MIAVYDLSVSPPTWDYARFLYRALCERGAVTRAIRLDAARGIVVTEPEPLEVLVVPGPQDGFRADRLPPEVPMRRQMLERIVLRYGDLFPAVTTRLVTREAAWQAQDGRHWPPGYDAMFVPRAYYAGPTVNADLAQMLQGGKRLPQIEVPGDAAAWASRRVGARRAALLVLRECAYWPARNSDLPAWTAFARWLQARGVAPLVVRDAATAGEPLEDLETVPEASTDLVKLAALTQAVDISFWVNHGTAALVWQGNPAPYRIFKPIVAGVPCCDRDYQTALGIGEDGRLPWATADQRYVWAADTLEALQGEWLAWEQSRMAAAALAGVGR